MDTKHHLQLSMMTSLHNHPDSSGISLVLWPWHQISHAISRWRLHEWVPVYWRQQILSNAFGFRTQVHILMMCKGIYTTIFAKYNAYLNPIKQQNCIKIGLKSWNIIHSITLYEGSNLSLYLLFKSSSLNDNSLWTT